MGEQSPAEEVSVIEYGDVGEGAIMDQRIQRLLALAARTRRD